METQSITNVIHGEESSLQQDISFLDLENGSWYLVIHSIWTDTATFGSYRGLIQVSCNLVTCRVSPRELRHTPLALVLISKNNNSNQLSIINSRKFAVTSKSSTIKFEFRTEFSRIFAPGAKIGIHFSLERFL